jgi:hypothetical protein
VELTEAREEAQVEVTAFAWAHASWDNAEYRLSRMNRIWRRGGDVCRPLEGCHYPAHSGVNKG